MAIQIDVTKYIKQAIHPNQLTVFNVQWLEALLYPLRNLLFRFYKQRTDDLYRIEHNGQVCYLRAVLNDIFDSQERRITITDAFRYNFVYFYPELDEKAVLHNTVLYPRAEFVGGEAVDFNVIIPTALGLTPDQETRMRSILDEYKLVSKKYAIVYE
jgi:hypothetical protein